jgi:hypothetical protein
MSWFDLSQGEQGAAHCDLATARFLSSAINARNARLLEDLPRYLINSPRPQVL